MALTIEDVLKIKEALQPEFEKLREELASKKELQEAKTDISQIKDYVAGLRLDVDSLLDVLVPQVEQNIKDISTIKVHLNLK